MPKAAPPCTLLALLALSVPGSAQLVQGLPPIYQRVDGLDYLGSVSLPTGTLFQGTEFGGISALTYDPQRGVYYALSDDRSQIDDARFYTLDIDVARGNVQVQIRSVVTLRDLDGMPFAPASIDPEGMARMWDGSFFISSEGDANNLLPASVGGFRRDGRQVVDLPIPDHYLPAATTGIRNNLAFESLTLAPLGLFLYTATEAALKQDGPIASLSEGSPTRILQFNAHTGNPLREFTYVTDPIPEAPDPPMGFADNGLVELLATDVTGGMLALERSFAVGRGNNIRLYEIRLPGILRQGPVGRGGLVVISNPVHKRLLANLGQQSIPVDNIEAMAFGPRLHDGRTLLVMAADNNFSASQSSLFVAFAVRFRGI